MNVLIDTSVWSLALRRRSHDLSAAEQAIVNELAELVRETRARIIGPVRQELLSGAKVPQQYEKLRLMLRAFLDELIETSDYEAAAKAGNDCRAKGIAASSIDMLICALTIARGWSIFTTDLDFKQYQRVLPLRLHLVRDERK